MNFDELLAIVKDIPDETEFELAGKKLRAADLKGLTSAEKAAAAKVLSDANSQKAQAAKDAEQAATILAELQKLQTTPAPKGNEGEDDWETNNWWTPARKQLAARDEKIKGLTDTITKLNTAFSNAATMFAQDRWERQYAAGQERLKRSAKAKDMTFDQVRDHAVNNKLLDAMGFPDVGKAIADLTREDELAAAISKAREDGIREGQTRARLNATPRPTSASGVAPKGVRGLDPEKNLEDLGDAVAEDPELMELVAQVQGMDPEDLKVQ